MPRSREQSHIACEIAGIVLLITGVVFFLSLISYAPGDVPRWYWLSSVAKAGAGTSNFIGPFGALLACTLYAFLGVAAYLLTAAALGYGAVKLLHPDYPLARRAPWIAAVILSAACLAEILPIAWIDADKMNLTSEGGWLGLWFGRHVFERCFSSVGAVLILSGVYVISVIYLTGLRPIAVARRLAQLPGEWRDKYDDFKLARADEDEALAIQAERAGRQAQKIERSLAKKPARRKIEPPDMPGESDVQLVIKAPRESEKTAPESSTAVIDEIGDLFKKAEPAATAEKPVEPARPAPQIIDSLALPPPPAKKKKKELPGLQPVTLENYTLPSMDLLDPIDTANRVAADPAELLAIQETIIETLAQFGISVSRGDITRGPTITRYEVYPAKGVSVDRVVSRERDLARATRAERINILAPIPGKDTVGVEIANVKKTKVTLRELLESEEFVNTKAKLPLALGKDVYGKTIIADLAAMPHCLVAGTTGSGKSVCVNSIIASLLYRYSPEDLRFIMIDPKVVEMQVYNTLPHLVLPVVTDPKKVLLALRWVIDEMEKRYKIFAKTGVRNITGFNGRPKAKSQKELDAEKEADLFDKAENGEAPAAIDLENASVEEKIESLGKITVRRDNEPIIPERMPYIVVIVDELADLMQTAPADVESAIARITQMARAAGIHMIVATQTPRADIVTGVIKANIPTRIAFQVASKIDSRVILDENGAERLLGQGDMLYLPPGSSKLIRAQGVLVTDEEIHRVVDHTSAQGDPGFDEATQEKMGAASSYGDEDEEEVSDDDEELVEKCIEVMRQEKKASTSLFQRRLRLGYTRAARILDILEARGYVAAGEGAKPREILVDLDRMA